jgi:adenylosuccinate synthase
MSFDLRPGKVNIVIGGQAGSEAKGKMSAYLANHQPVELVTMAASPNAGHTYVDDDGKKWVSYHMPAAAKPCLEKGGVVVLGPTSVINKSTFMQELDDLGLLSFIPKSIFVDVRATIIDSECIAQECGGTLSDIGSTLQGVGAARMRKIGRGHSGDIRWAVNDEYLLDQGIVFRDTNQIIWNFIMSNAVVLHEMSQGFDLDLEHGISPLYCTSKMVNTSMGLAEIGMPPQLVGEVIGVIRPYPIRVNNRTGYSGPYGEAREIEWEEVARRCGHPNPEELVEMTTTTKLKRRVFEFSWERYEKFVTTCCPTQICLNFVNYLDWKAYGIRHNNLDLWMIGYEKINEFIHKLEDRGATPVRYLGTGPRDCEMVGREMTGMAVPTFS